MSTPNRSKTSPPKRQANHDSCDKRSEARRLALQFLYQAEAQKGANLDQLDKFLIEYCEHEEARLLAHDWILGTWHDLEKIDATIDEACANWDLKRINEVDRSNLRLGVHQMLNCPDIPRKVVINEAIELAKEFSTAQASAFLNGVLDAVNRKLAAEK